MSAFSAAVPTLAHYRILYPKQPDGNRYPVVDFVICHGDFLNAGRGYVHKNKAVKFFGSYGDILIRDRKMYVVPTPFRLIEGAAHHQTLVLPAEDEPGADFFEVGQLVRSECPEIIIGYSFDLTTNTLTPRTGPTRTPAPNTPSGPSESWADPPIR